MQSRLYPPTGANIANMLRHIVEFCLGTLWLLAIFVLVFYMAFWLPAEILSSAGHHGLSYIWMLGIALPLIEVCLRLFVFSAWLWRKHVSRRSISWTAYRESCFPDAVFA